MNFHVSEAPHGQPYFVSTETKQRVHSRSQKKGLLHSIFCLYSMCCLHYQSALPPEAFVLDPRRSNMQCLYSDLKCNSQHYNETMKRYVQIQRLCRSVFKILRGSMSARE